MSTATVFDKAVSNADFGRRVGVHYTYASRLRNGQRAPSTHTITAIRQAFELSDTLTMEMMDALAAGDGAFGAWVNKNLFTE